MGRCVPDWRGRFRINRQHETSVHRCIHAVRRSSFKDMGTMRAGWIHRYATNSSLSGAPMNIFFRLLHFLFPPSRMAGCTPPTKAERLALYERRLGEHRAQERLRDARIEQLCDERAIVRPKITPKLPEDRKVVSISRKRAA